jgi:hypothetical protein
MCRVAAHREIHSGSTLLPDSAHEAARSSGYAGYFAGATAATGPNTGPACAAR